MKIKTKIAGILLAIILFAACSQNEIGLVRLDRMRAEDYFSGKAQVDLARAVGSGRLDLAQNALVQGAKVNARGKEGSCPLMWALAKRNKAGFSFLLEHGANANVNNENTNEPMSLMEIVSTMPDAEYLQLALQHGGNPNYPVVVRRTVIFDAIIFGNSANVEALIRGGANLNYRDGSGETPLVAAARNNQYHAAYLLLQAGADPSIKDNWGYDLAGVINHYGSRGISLISGEMVWYDKVVEELKARGCQIHPR